VKIATRHLLSSLVVVVALTLTLAFTLDRRLHARISHETHGDLTREARLIAALWTPGTSAALLAHDAGRALGHRVTLIRSDGTVVGDSDFDSTRVATLENHAARPEVVSALRDSVGSARRSSPSRGDEELYVAVRASLGVVRVSQTTQRADAIANGTASDVIAAGTIAALVALALATVLANAISRPVVELRNVTRALASGDLSRRPAMGGPGEVGELANAVRSMSEQLDDRMRTLAEDESLLAAVVESLGEGVLAVDPRMQVVRTNAAARALLDLHDATPFPVERLPGARELRAALAEALQGTIAEPREMPLGDRVLVITGRPLPRGGAVLAVSDLTRTRRLEAVRRDFVANVSHELRTPLTVIGGFAETLAEGSVSSEDRTRFARLIAANTQRMQRVVDELLDLSRIESGGWVPRPATVDVGEVATDVLGANAAAAQRQGVALDARISANAREVYADRTALRQILGNLVENAIRHTSEGSIVIVASRDTDGWTTVGVRDTGSGIAPQHLPRIFERFYRVDTARSRESGGTGLGLSIVKHLVEAHGGRVHAESTPGSGTLITASFPPAPAVTHS
jgi:signal transduction histidine kinase